MNVGLARARVQQVRQPEGSLPTPILPQPAPSTSTPAAGGGEQREPGKISMPSGRWARYASKLGTTVAILGASAAIKKEGLEPNEVDDEDCDLFNEALEEGLRERFGDGPIPWWLGALFAGAGMYTGMRYKAKKIGAREIVGMQADAAAAPTQPQRPQLVPAPSNVSKPEPAKTVFRVSSPPIQPIS